MVDQVLEEVTVVGAGRPAVGEKLTVRLDDLMVRLCQARVRGLDVVVLNVTERNAAAAWRFLERQQSHSRQRLKIMTRPPRVAARCFFPEHRDNRLGDLDLLGKDREFAIAANRLGAGFLEGVDSDRDGAESVIQLLALELGGVEILEPTSYFAPGKADARERSADRQGDGKPAAFGGDLAEGSVGRVGTVAP